MNKITHNGAVGMRISPSVLESICRKMIEVVLFCLPNSIRGTIYTVGPMPQLRVIRIATGHRRGEADEIQWDGFARSDYDFPGKVWEDYRDRPGGILEAMAWCVEKQKSWTSDDPEHNVRSVRKQLEGKAGEDYHHMEPVLVQKTELWDQMVPSKAYRRDSDGNPVWQTGPFATVAVIKIHFLPGTIRSGDRSTRVIKELSQSLGTQMLSLHAKEVVLEKKKRLIEGGKETRNIIAHEFRNLMIRIGFAYRIINNEISYLRESWESLLGNYLPEQSSKQAILERLEGILRQVEAESSNLEWLTVIRNLSECQKELMESHLLPQQNEMWLQNKIRPLWHSLLLKINSRSSQKKNVEKLLEELRKSFYIGLDKRLRDKVKDIPEELKSRWLDLAYREINGKTGGELQEYIEFLHNSKLKLSRKKHSQKNFIFLKALVELIPEIENKLNHRLDELKTFGCEAVDIVNSDSV